MGGQKILATVALLAVLGTAHATRVLEQPEVGYELTLQQLTLPASASGGVTMKRCDDCAYSTHVLTGTTQFFVNELPLPYAEFKRLVDEARADRRTTAFAGLFLDVETGRVTRVTLFQAGL